MKWMAISSRKRMYSVRTHNSTRVDEGHLWTLLAIHILYGVPGSTCARYITPYISNMIRRVNCCLSLYQTIYLVSNWGYVLEQQYNTFRLAAPATLAVRGRFLTVVLPYDSVYVSFNYFSWRFSWLHSQAVQRCGSGFWGAASSTHAIVGATGIFPYSPYFCICGSSVWASVMVRPWIPHISAYAAHQGGLVLWYGLGRPVITSKIGH